MQDEPFILIIDGEIGSANLLKMRLESTGYKVATSLTGKDAFLSVVDNIPDAIVTNVNLPDMSGLEIYNHLQEYPEWKATQIVFIADQRENLSEIGPNHKSLVKPYDPSELLTLIEEALERKEKAGSSETETLPASDEKASEEAGQTTESGDSSGEDGISAETEESAITPEVNLKELSIPNEVIEKIPPKYIWHYKFVPIECDEKTMKVATSQDNNVVLRDDLRQFFGYIIKPVLATEQDIDDAITKYYGIAGETVDQIFDPESEQVGEGLALDESSSEDIAKMAEDASVIKLVNQILIEANEKGATDIHIEPYQGRLELRYRIDGVLADTKIPQNMVHFLPAIISRIKIMSGLNIVERRLPQDGRANVNIKNERFDLRVSTIPTEHGESIVIRVLPSKMLFSLEKLGFSDKELKIFEDLIKRPHGVIFVTGPTGSGKSTTLYAALTKIKEVNPGAKIITIEDPVEYQLEGITQVQVNSEIDFTFARGLRSLLRHDPDIMMVGEVRDYETAEISMRMALTGHLLFSTLHTNDAASGVARLLDIGIEPYLVSSSVNAFIGQRLIRTICSNCKEEIEKNEEIINEIEAMRGEISEVRDQREDEDKKTKREINKIRDGEEEASGWLREGEKCFRGKGCDNCNFSGYRGRTSIFEILQISENIRNLIAKKVSSDEIRREAIKEGMRSMYQHGFDKVVSGETTFEEILRVVKEEEAV